MIGEEPASLPLTTQIPATAQSNLWSPINPHCFPNQQQQQRQQKQQPTIPPQSSSLATTTTTTINEHAPTVVPAIRVAPLPPPQPLPTTPGPTCTTPIHPIVELVGAAGSVAAGGVGGRNIAHDCYASLLGFAETFRTMSPPNIRLAVHCLKAVFHLKLPTNLEARTHLQLGRLLYHYSKSDDQIKYHLERARTIATSLKAKDDCMKFEASALLAEFFERKVGSVRIVHSSLV